MTTGFSCPSFFQALKYLTFSTFPPRSNSVPEISPKKSEQNKSDLLSSLIHFQAKPELFVAKIFTNSGLSIYKRLLLVEHLLDEDFFNHTFLTLPRDTIDKIVPYELQNVRAYFYYLTLKSRIRSHKTTHSLDTLTDKKLYSYSFEKIMAELLNNVRFGGLLLVFFSYCRVNASTELSILIFQKRIDLFEDLYEESVCLLLFVLVNLEDNITDFSCREILENIKAIKSLSDKYTFEIKTEKPGIQFQDNTKKITKEFLNPLICYFQTLLFVKNKTTSLQLAELNEIGFFVESQKNKFKQNKSAFFEDLSLSLKRKIVQAICVLQKDKNQLIRSRKGVIKQYFPLLFWTKDKSITSPNADIRQSVQSIYFKEDKVNSSFKLNFNGKPGVSQSNVQKNSKLEDATENTVANELIKRPDFKALKESTRKQKNLIRVARISEK